MVVSDRSGRVPRFVVVGEETATLRDQVTGLEEEVGTRPYSTRQLMESLRRLKAKGRSVS
jgi:hypothetical protein